MGREDCEIRLQNMASDRNTSPKRKHPESELLESMGSQTAKDPPTLKCTLQFGLGMEAQQSFGVRLKDFHDSFCFLSGWSWVRDVPSLSLHLLTYTQGIILPNGGVV